MKKTSYNLFDAIQVTRENNKIYTVIPIYPREQLPEVESVLGPDDMFDLCIYAEGKIVSAGYPYGDILVIDDSIPEPEEKKDIWELYFYVETLPKWTETSFVAIGISNDPHIYYANGKHASVIHGLKIMRILGYEWNPNAERFEKRKKKTETIH